MKLGKKEYDCDFYMGENLTQGLEEAIHCINELVSSEEQSEIN